MRRWTIKTQIGFSGWILQFFPRLDGVTRSYNRVRETACRLLIVPPGYRNGRIVGAGFRITQFGKAYPRRTPGHRNNRPVGPNV